MEKTISLSSKGAVEDKVGSSNTVKEMSVKGGNRSKSFSEEFMKIIFTVCGFAAVAAVAAITIYMLIAGVPAIFKVGIAEMLFGTVWAPTAAEPSFGIAYIFAKAMKFQICCQKNKVSLLSAVLNYSKWSLLPSHFDYKRRLRGDSDFNLASSPM